MLYFIGIVQEERRTIIEDFKGFRAWSYDTSAAVILLRVTFLQR